MGMVTLAVLPANAGVHIGFSGGSFHGSVNIGGGFRGGSFSNTGGRRCGYSPYCNRFRCGYNFPFYGGYGFYGGYLPSVYDSYAYGPGDDSAMGPVPESVPPPQAIAPAPTTPPVAPPAPSPLEFGILDVNGFVHSPYSDAVFKVPGVRNAQMVYDPVTGKPFLVR